MHIFHVADKHSLPDLEDDLCAMWIKILRMKAIALVQTIAHECDQLSSNYCAISCLWFSTGYNWAVVLFTNVFFSV